MKRNKLTTLIIGAATVSAFFLFIYTLQGAVVGRSSYIDSGIYAPATTTIVRSGDYSVPSRLKVPSIRVDAKVQHVGLTKNGQMGIPTNFTDVGWYKYGSIPGERGSAVIAGHVDNGLGLSGVFKNLEKVSVGDEIFVEDSEGKTARFVVTKINEYPYDKAPAKEIFNKSEKTILHLITCGGRWIRSLKTYETRLVVTAEYSPKEL